jgi:hypothetical protein
MVVKESHLYSSVVWEAPRFNLIPWRVTRAAQPLYFTSDTGKGNLIAIIRLLYIAGSQVRLSTVEKHGTENLKAASKGQGEALSIVLEIEKQKLRIRQSTLWL